MKKKISNKNIIHQIELITNTAAMLTNQVKGNLDKNMLEKNVFRPNLQSHAINKVVETTIKILRMQADSAGVKINF